MSAGPKGRLRKRLLVIAACALAPLAAVSCAAWGVGWWLDYSQEPEKADLIVVLAGEYSRSLYAADLYRRGFAPEVWVSRSIRSTSVRLALEDGVSIPSEESIHREILLKRGVPPGSIRLYGEDLMSTANEALALGRAVDTRGLRILVVTSRPHARRAGLIFRGMLPEAEIRVVATPYEPFTRRWWTRQSMAKYAVLETAKLAYYLLGGRFIAGLEDTPHVP